MAPVTVPRRCSMTRTVVRLAVVTLMPITTAVLARADVTAAAQVARSCAVPHFRVMGDAAERDLQTGGRAHGAAARAAHDAGAAGACRPARPTPPSSSSAIGAPIMPFQPLYDGKPQDGGRLLRRRRDELHHPAGRRRARIAERGLPRVRASGVGPRRRPGAAPWIWGRPGRVLQHLRGDRRRQDGAAGRPAAAAPVAAAGAPPAVDHPGRGGPRLALPTTNATRARCSTPSPGRSCTTSNSARSESTPRSSRRS